MHRHPHALTTWLAIWSLVLGACLPVLSQAAVRLTDRLDWVEVCTSTGMTWVRADGSIATDDPAGTAEGTVAGCDLCLLHGGTGDVPPRGGATVLHDADAGTGMAEPFVSAWTTPRWRPDNTRAPPDLG